MITLDELREKQIVFLTKIDDVRKDIKILEKKREQFIKAFPRDSILSMSLDDYVIGKGSKKSFCNWLLNDSDLRKLGRMGGFSQQFDIWYDPKQNEYSWTEKKFGVSLDEAFIALKEEIKALLDAGKIANTSNIIENKLSPGFKGKILSTYLHKQYLPVFADSHLNHFLQKLGLLTSDKKKKDVVLKRLELVHFKDTDEVMKEWSMEEFHRFLYDTFGYPPEAKELHSALLPYVEIELRECKPVFVEFELKDLLETQKQTHINESQRSYPKCDFEEKSKKNAVLGSRGEDIVVLAEKSELKKLGKSKLANSVEKKSEQSDSLGYDILSFDEKECKKYIEVKTTNAKTMQSFHFSENQLRTAKEFKENYWVYLVVDANSKCPKIFRLHNLYDLWVSKKLSFNPTAYKVNLNIEALL